MPKLRAWTTSAKIAITLCLALRAACAAAEEPPPFAPPTGVVTLRQALAATQLGNPQLAASAEGIHIRDAHARQADLLPNPELKAEVENVGGSGQREGFETTETTLRLSQLIELGGKRGRRVSLAGVEREAAVWEHELRRRELLAHTTKAFVAVLALQQKVALAADLVGLAQRSARIADAELRSGAGSEAESLRAKVSLGEAELERSQRARELASARIELAAAWGSSTPTFERAAGDLAAGLAAGDAAVPAAADSAAVARSRTEHDARRAALAVEQARAIPDLTLGAGPRYFSDNDDVALVLELWLPLPVFDRNQGAIDAARAALAQAEADQRATELAVATGLAQARQARDAALARARDLQRTIIPAAEAAYASSEDAYRHGAVRSLDVLDAQRTLFGLREQAIDALADYHRANADIDRLGGGAPASEEP